MLKHRFYYTVKPFIPWHLRMALRRIAARRTLATCKSIWPINEAARRLPEGWPGWPEGKQFAVVLTHDVESADGLEKCRKLIALEEKLGFRSSFNFIPEGGYAVSPELRREITNRGFEVGVHDLKHDGKLFRSHRTFQQNAVRINHYIREWGASGYRSGFMLRNLDWLHELDIQYDCSTFDTDPFELQSDGAGTIFPFWIPRPAPARVNPDQNGHVYSESPPTLTSIISDSPSARAGYIELPYTLPQDSTLFIVMRETSPAIWIQKLDWIAAHGGMALINVHPDYIRYGDEAVSHRTYPSAFYTEFLEHIRRRYAGKFWQPLPREMAQFTRQMERPPTVHRRKRVCMITYSFYESDNRVTRYAAALAARGDRVDVLSLRRSEKFPKREVMEGVNVFRIQDRFGKTERSKFAYLWPLLRFLGKSSCWVTRRHARRHYDLLHVHNMPDFLVFAAWYPRLTGSKVILDVHDIVPEFYTSKFSGGKSSATTIVLKLVEWISARFAHHVIVSNHLWLQKFATRTGTERKSSVFINNVDTRVFQPRPRTRRDEKLIILFPGGLQWHQGLDIALRAFSKVSAELPQAEFHIYGDGNMKASLVALAAELGFNGKVKFFEPVRVKEVAQIMADADLGVVPKRADSFGNEAYSTKIMEFMSLGVPVVVSKTKIDQYYFNDSVVRFFQSGDSDALADAMLEVLQNAELRRSMIANASAYSTLHSWKLRKADYLRIVDDMIGPSEGSVSTDWNAGSGLTTTPKD